MSEFGMSEANKLLVDMVSTLLKEHCRSETVLAAVEGAWPSELWQVLEETGLPRMAVPEEAGGSGAPLSEALATLRVAGQFAAPVPLAETILAGWLLSGSGFQVPAGPLTVAPVRAGERIHLERGSSGWRLSGSVTRLPWARHAERIALLAESAQQVFAVQVPRTACRIQPEANLAGEPRDTVHFDAVTLSDDEVRPAGAGITPENLYTLGALTRVLLTAGALERALEQSVQYVSERKQFARPLAKFQVLQHYLAVFAAEVASVGTAAEAALASVERAAPRVDEARLAIASAKVRAGEAAGKCAAIAHQVHGAIGFTYEHPLHLTTRRLWSWRDEFGNEAAWARWLGDRVLAAGGDGLWPLLTS